MAAAASHHKENGPLLGQIRAIVHSRSSCMPEHASRHLVEPRDAGTWVCSTRTQLIRAVRASRSLPSLPEAASKPDRPTQAPTFPEHMPLLFSQMYSHIISYHIPGIYRRHDLWSVELLRRRRPPPAATRRRGPHRSSDARSTQPREDMGGYCHRWHSYCCICCRRGFCCCCCRPHLLGVDLACTAQA